MEVIDNLIKRIGKSILEGVPKNSEWATIKFSMKILITYSESNAKRITNDSEDTFSVVFKDENGRESFPDTTWLLREAMYSTAPEKGAWFSMEMIIKRDGKFELKFDYDNKPEFSIPLDDEDFVKDFRKFPRTNDTMPKWLFDILKRSNAVQ
jgi:hypothetical protein